MPLYLWERIMLWWVRGSIRACERRLATLKTEESKRVKALEILRGAKT